LGFRNKDETGCVSEIKLCRYSDGSMQLLVSALPNKEQEFIDICRKSKIQTDRHLDHCVIAGDKPTSQATWKIFQDHVTLVSSNGTSIFLSGKVLGMKKKNTVVPRV
jgi:hypothetical protein